MVKIGKYTSRRTQALRSGGSLIPQALKQATNVVENAVSTIQPLGEVKVRTIETDGIHATVRDNARTALNEAFKSIQNPLEQDPQDLIDVAQKHIESAPHHAHEILGLARKVPALHNFRTRQASTRFSDKRHDFMALAHRVRQQFSQDAHPKMHHKRVAGALDFKSIFSDTKKLAEGFNPADSAGAAMDSFNKINLHDTSAKGIAKNALHGYAGNLRAHAAYAQTAGLALTPAVALGAAVPMAGFAATGQGFRQYANVMDAVNERL